MGEILGSNKYCQKINDDRTKDVCLSNVAKITDDSTLCEGISKDNRKDSCYMNFVIDKKDYTTSQDNQRRLLYVAITRSMKYLFISSSMRMPSYQRPQLPSEFIADLADDMILKKPVPDPTKRKKSNNFTAVDNEVFPTNFSELGYFFDCPHDFWLRHVLGFNPEIMPLIGYGKSIHNILNNIHKTLQRGKEVKVDSIINKNFHLRFSNKEGEENSKKKASLVVKNYLKTYKEDIELSLETEKPFEMILGNSLISGQIDLIRKQTPRGEEITIVEFKTEKDPDEFRKTKHKDQVLLYAIAYEKSFGKNPENLYVHYLDEKAGKREKVEINKENITVDLNHPLAGEFIQFAILVRSIE
ncbi:MAG: PD-(D/E)XK nuclease family protein [Bacteroidetes bacterium]|nr:PD-(D/E)XK nuclease family protein [Bacteroidota bacterium]